MKRILFVIESMGMGGAEKSLNALLRNIDFGEDSVELLLLDDTGIFLKGIPPHIKIRLWNQAHFPILKRIEFFVKRKLNLKRQHDAHYFWEIFKNQFEPLPEQYDVAIAYSQGFATHFTAEKVNALKKIAWVNVDYEKANYNINSDAQFYRKFDQVMAVSLFLKLRLKELFSMVGIQTPVEVIYDITSTEEILNRSKETSVDLNTEGFSILTVGRMVPLKGYDLAVETAAILNENGLKFCWYFVGDGADNKRIQNLINERKLNEVVKILGFRENPYPYMNGCSIYVQTSRYEGWGLTLVEAKILGKPVVTTNFPTAYEIISDGENGFVTEMNAKALSEKIDLLIKDEVLRKKMSCNNIVEVEARNKHTIGRFLKIDS